MILKFLCKGRKYLFIVFVLTCEIFLLDLFAFAVGFCIMSTIIAATRDSFVYMTSGRTRHLDSVMCKWAVTALKSCPLLFIWVSNLINVVSYLFFTLSYCSVTRCLLPGCYHSHSDRSAG